MPQTTHVASGYILDSLTAHPKSYILKWLDTGCHRLALTSVALRAPSVSAKQDISTLQRIGHFYFALTQHTPRVSSPEHFRYNPFRQMTSTRRRRDGQSPPFV